MTALRKVLVVDDDPIVRKSFDRVLSGKGYAVITATSGEEALRKLNEENYDLVYSDIRMPGISGLDVAETIKARQPWTPVVIITGYGSDAAEVRAKAAGVSSFLHKPLSPDMIEGSARDVLAAAATAAATVEPVAAAVAAEPIPAGRSSIAALAKDIALFFAAPFIGLAYIIALPVYGCAVLAYLIGTEALKYTAVRTAAKVLKHVAMVVAAPFVGLGLCRAVPVRRHRPSRLARGQNGNRQGLIRQTV